MIKMSVDGVIDLISSEDDSQRIELSSSPLSPLESYPPEKNSEDIGSLNKDLTLGSSMDCPADLDRNPFKAGISPETSKPCDLSGEKFNSRPSNRSPYESPTDLVPMSTQTLEPFLSKSTNDACPIKTPSVESHLSQQDVASPKDNHKTLKGVNASAENFVERNISMELEKDPVHSFFSHDLPKSEDFFKAVPVNLQLSDSDDELPPIVIPSKAAHSEDESGSSLSCDESNSETQNFSYKPPQRKRSCSITPPPEFSPLPKTFKMKIAAARKSTELMKSSYPHLPNQELDLLDLDPEYQAIIRNKQSSFLSSKDTSQPSTADLQAKCKIRCNFPKIEGFVRKETKFHKPIEFHTRLNETFEQMFQYICRNKDIPADKLVVEYKGVTLYPRSTPFKLGISPTLKTVFDVFSQGAYQQLLIKRKLAENERLLGDDLPNLSSPEPELETDEAALISISVRLPIPKDNVEAFKLKASTKICKILESLRKLREISPDANIRLDFDGEYLDPESTVQDAGLENEDMLDLHIF